MPDNHKSTDFSDIDLSRWKDYDDVILDSLWLLGPRDKTGPHVGDYWGNFISQIPYQVLTRFTKRGEVVVDLFSGMGTTLIECKRLGRAGLGGAGCAVAKPNRATDAATPQKHRNL